MNARFGLGTPAEAGRFQKIFAVAVAVAFTYLFLRLIAPFIEAVLLAAVLTGMLYPLFHRVLAVVPYRPAASILTVAGAFFAIILPLLFVLGASVREAIRLSERWAPWVESQLERQQDGAPLPSWVPFDQYLQPYRRQILESLGEFLNQAGTFLVDGLSVVTTGTLMFVLNLFIMLYAMFFFFLAGARWLEFFDYTPLPPHDRKLIVEKGVSIARATVKGTFVIGVVQGLLGGIGFAVAGLPGPIFWGAVMAVASFIPGIGAAIVWIPAVAYLLATDVTRGIALGVWSALIVSGIDNLLRPRLVGSDTRMPDVLILLSTLGGIAMFGVSGVILGPIVAGFFITSWHIFAATFRRELERSEASPGMLDGEQEGLPPEVEEKVEDGETVGRRGCD
ncbi:MAG: AI-2E family transporter [Gammaproteobacteria bacterium]|nr:AI-2E family transporter [Gammaproteobacteria bacterium]